MEETIENLVDYVKYIQELDKEYVLSRGQGQDKVLLPSVFRLDDRNMRLYSNTTAKEFIEEFKNNSVLYLDNHTRNIDNEFEWIILAQHFGVPTCLLDFTYSHMVSLMFALEKAFDYSDNDDGSSVVWFLNPQKLNLESINRNVILNLSEETKVLETAKYAKGILASLYTMGMRFKDIYPELTSVSKDILLKHNVMEYYRMEAENE